MKLKSVLAAVVTALVATSSHAGLLWGNSAGGSLVIEAVDQTTLAVVHQYNAGSGNGRSVVVVGNVVYYTRVGDSSIYKMDANTGALLGSIATSVSSMSTLAWDGSQFWTSDYAGTNKVFRIDVNGVTTKTVSLSLAQNYMDGVEYFNGKLISNRCDACGVYDIYDLDGNLLDDAFITSASNSTGIAFDGTNFIVSNIFNNSVSRFDGITGALIDTRTIGAPNPGRLWEDLSVDYAARSDTGGGNVPEPGSLLLAGVALAGLAASRARAKKA